MDKLPAITVKDISKLASVESYGRGEDYYHNGNVLDMQRRGNVVSAEVQGSQYEPYSVVVELGTQGIISTNCSCPYDGGGICKHIVAVLLTYFHEAEEIVVYPEPAEILRDLGREELYRLLMGLIEAHPKLIEWVESRVKTKARKSQSKKQKKEKPQPQEESIRHRIRDFFYSLRHMHPYYAAARIPGPLAEIENQARIFLEKDDGKRAVPLLVVLLEELSKVFEIVDDSDGSVGDYIISLGTPLAEAILSAEFEAEDREELVSRLNKLYKALNDYGVGEALEIAIQAANKGWQAQCEVNKEKDQLKAFDEEDTEEDDWMLEYAPHTPDIHKMKLNILERRGKLDEFFQLASQTGNHLLYVLKLIGLHRIDEAVSYAQQHLDRAVDVYSIAKKLHEKGFSKQAFTLAEWGLSLAGEKYTLGNWIGEVGETAPSLALKARVEAFRSLPTLEGYQAISLLAGKEWDALKPQIMEILKKKGDPETLAEVYLCENQIYDALRIAEKDKANDELLAKVADAAITVEPEWVIRIAGKQADDLIGRKKSKYYEAAICWITKIKQAYMSNNRQKEWKAYLTHFKIQHKSKRSLLKKFESLEKER